VCVCVCMCVCVCVHACIYMCVCLCVCECLYIYMCVCVWWESRMTGVLKNLHWTLNRFWNMKNVFWMVAQWLDNTKHTRTHTHTHSHTYFNFILLKERVFEWTIWWLVVLGAKYNKILIYIMNSKKLESNLLNNCHSCNKQKKQFT